MKVVHICTEINSGGAANSAVNLHQGLRKLGVDSWILAKSLKENDDFYVVDPDFFKLELLREQTTEQLLSHNRSLISNTHYSLNLIGSSLGEHPLIRSADVINLHWVSDYLSSSSIAELLALGKVVVWTLHDMRPLTGGCHFSAGCKRYIDGCHHCPQLLNDYSDLSTKCQHFSAMAIAKSTLHWVAPSSWMDEKISIGRVSKGFDRTLIPYGIDASIYTIGDKSSARVELHLAHDVWYILLASHNFKEIRKGGEQALEVLQIIKDDPVTGEEVASGKVRILCCGHNSEGFTADGWKIDSVGHLSQAKMTMLYQSADVLLFTSVEDNLPNVLMEAIACGLPVVANDVGGVRDLIGEEGIEYSIFDQEDAESGAQKVIHFYQNRGLADDVSKREVERMKEFFSLESQATRYRQLYQELLNKKNTAQKEVSPKLGHIEMQALVSGLSAKLKKLEEREVNHMSDLKLAQILKKSLWVKLGQLLGFCYR